MKGHPRLVSLGPSVLRAETAGLVAVGVYVTWQEARSLRQERQKISPAAKDIARGVNAARIAK
jgi:hypothetical protein